MKIVARQVDNITVVDVAGRLDTQTSADAQEKLLAIGAGKARNILLNLEALDYVSSVGLLAIINLAKALRETDGELKICNINGVVAQVMEISHIGEIVECHPTEQDGLSSFQPS